MPHKFVGTFVVFEDKTEVMRFLMLTTFFGAVVGFF
jgi:hypothetical protein